MFTVKYILDDLAKLFPICRSITGKGLRKSLLYFQEKIPEFKRISFKSGQKVGDWRIPLEWNITDAYIMHIDTQEKFACFKENNLHIMSYSIPVNKVLELDELVDHIYSLPEQPDLIPYVTSYYEPNWGFCLEENIKSKLPKGKYRVVIDSVLEKGTLDLIHASIKGSTKKEILFTSYLCHPSMANNELSGPLLIGCLVDHIKNVYKDRTFSYRFVIHPETIGSISYISKFKKKLIQDTICGFNLSCVGDDRAFSHIQSPSGGTIADKALTAALIDRKNKKTYDFLRRGSDERQYCSPAMNLPYCSFSRSKYGEYPEYHTSGDNLNVVSNAGFEGSFDVMSTIVDAFEKYLIPISNVTGEPQLSKYNLYPGISMKRDSEKTIRRDLLNILAYSNGENTIFDICIHINISLEKVIERIVTLEEHKLIKFMPPEQWFKKRKYSS